MSEIQNLIEKLDKDTIKDIMADNGAILYKEKEEELWYNTICHGGHSHKLCCYLSNKNFYCYTNCGSMNIISLLMNVRKCDVREAILYLQNFTGKNTSRIGFTQNRIADSIFIDNTDRLIEIKRREEQNKDKNKKEKYNIYEENILNYFEKKYYNGWIKDGISILSMEKFGIKWYELEKHIIIPHRNCNGDLIGVRRRSLKPEDEKNKYMPEIIEGITYGHPLGLNLYGLYENKKAIQKRKTVLIVEGEKSVLLSDTFFGDKSIAVATCGFNITDWQLNKILEYNVDNVYLAFDKDYALMNFEKRYAENSLEYQIHLKFIKRINSLAMKIRNDCSNVRIIIDRKNLLSLKDSPLDKGKEIFKELEKDSLLNEIKLKDLRS